MNDLEQENKQLQSGNDRQKEMLDGYLNEIKSLKEDLENTINQLTLRNDSVDNLKAKLEKIQKWFDKTDSYYGYSLEPLEEILGEKK